MGAIGPHRHRGGHYTIVSAYEGAMVLATEPHHRADRARQLPGTSMNYPISPRDRSGRHAASQIVVDTTRQIATPYETAANDEAFDRNPLWMIAGAFACLFIILALLLASG